MSRPPALIPFLVVVVFAMDTGHAQGNEPRCARAKLELESFNAALDLRHGLTGSLPEDSEWFEALVREHLVSASERNSDPWGRAYVYSKNGSTFDLMTAGADGQIGTSDDQIKADHWQWRTCGDGCARAGCLAC
jgi:hypothetical protein